MDTISPVPPIVQNLSQDILDFLNNSLTGTLSFLSLAHILSDNVEEGGVSDVYCSPPPGGDVFGFTSGIFKYSQRFTITM